MKTLAEQGWECSLSNYIYLVWRRDCSDSLKLKLRKCHITYFKLLTLLEQFGVWVGGAAHTDIWCEVIVSHNTIYIVFSLWCFAVDVLQMQNLYMTTITQRNKLIYDYYI